MASEKARISEVDRLVILRDWAAAAKLCKAMLDSAQGRQQGASMHGVLTSSSGGLRVSLSPDHSDTMHTIVSVLYLQCYHELQAEQEQLHTENETAENPLTVDALVDDIATDEAALKYMHLHGPAPFDAAIVWIRSRIARAMFRQQQHQDETLFLSVAAILKELCASYSQYVGQAAVMKQEKLAGASENMYSSLVELLLFHVLLPPPPYGLGRQQEVVEFLQANKLLPAHKKMTFSALLQSYQVHTEQQMQQEQRERERKEQERDHQEQEQTKEGLGDGGARGKSKKKSKKKSKSKGGSEDTAARERRRRERREKRMKAQRYAGLLGWVRMLLDGEADKEALKGWAAFFVVVIIMFFARKQMWTALRWLGVTITTPLTALGELIYGGLD